jgi:hypothetical protein
METVAGLEERIVKDIKEENITHAIHIRNYLGGIAKVKGKDTAKIMKNIAQGECNIYDGYKKTRKLWKNRRCVSNLKQV